MDILTDLYMPAFTIPYLIIGHVAIHHEASCAIAINAFPTAFHSSTHGTSISSGCFTRISRQNRIFHAALRR